MKIKLCILIFIFGNVSFAQIVKTNKKQKVIHTVFYRCSDEFRESEEAQDEVFNEHRCKGGIWIKGMSSFKVAKKFNLKCGEGEFLEVVATANRCLPVPEWKKIATTKNIRKFARFKSRRSH